VNMIETFIIVRGTLQEDPPTTTHKQQPSECVLQTFMIDTDICVVEYMRSLVNKLHVYCFLSHRRASKFWCAPAHALDKLNPALEICV
jgi:hypothetical protein